MTADLLEQALALHRNGQLAKAAESYAAVIRTDPSHADAWHLSGLVAAQTGDAVEARRRIERAIALQPDRAIYLVNLGRLLRQTNCPTEAIAALDRALVLDPRQPEVLIELAQLMAARNELAAAIALSARAVALQPDRRDWGIELAAFLLDAKQFDAAAAALQEILKRRPGDADTTAALGQVRVRQQRHDEAIALYERALAIQPDCALAEDGLIASLTRLARTEDALRVIDRVLTRRPDNAVFRSRRLFLLNYLPKLSAAGLASEHRDWGARLCQLALPTGTISQRREPRRAPQEKLRIAYVSADFKRHSVAYFIEPVLAGHDRRRVEVFCYSSTHNPDDVTARLSTLADVWREVLTLNDDALYDQIVADRVDLLIDLSGHTADHRLGVFARRAAPVQLSWLGYPHSTGLPTMDYRIGDAITDPPGVADDLASEQMLRLSDGFLCYRPASSTPTDTVFLPPSAAGQAMTFGSFNHVAKLNRQVITVWAELLHKLPGSRLYLKAPGIGAASTAERLRGEFQAAGVSPERLLLGGATPEQADHLASYRQVDIALDPFPYNGTTTTFDALWMGVPVITLRGDRHAGRVGASLLSTLGHPELIADSSAEYIALACRLAGDPGRLAMLHGNLRDALRRSPLMDQAGFVKKLEAAYFHAWQTEK